jgi:hypothetical protein
MKEAHNRQSSNNTSHNYPTITEIVSLFELYKAQHIDYDNPEIVATLKHITEADIKKRNENNKNLDRAISKSIVLLNNPIVSTDEKFYLFCKLLKYDDITSNLSVDILCKWRDSLRFLKGVDEQLTLDILYLIIRESNISSHERIVTATLLYNTCHIDICYKAFSELIYDENMDVSHRLDAIKFLFATGEDEERGTAQDCLMVIITDHKYKCELRYSAIASYITNKGIVTTINANKLKIPYDELFVYSLQIQFFHDENNEVKYRILSGQHLLQMTNSSEEDKTEVTAILFSISTDVSYSENVRADAADVILRLGNSFNRAKARKIITDMGLSADGKKKRLFVGPKSIYENSQNVHTESISKHVEAFIERMLAPSENKNCGGSDESPYNIAKYSYQQVSDEISNYLHELTAVKKVDAFARNAVYGALHRISVDTATFTKHNATLSEILIFVWSRINSSEFDAETTSHLKMRMIDELSDMNDTCSSGYASRFVNALSTVDDTLHIDWSEQLEANVSGRMNAKIRDCQDDEIKGGIVLGMMEGADESYIKIYLDFVTEGLEQVENELFEEFVKEGHIKETNFKEYMNVIKNNWLKIQHDEQKTCDSLTKKCDG